MSSTNSTTNKRRFQHLNSYQRGEIQALMRQKVPKTQIANQLGISRSTLYEELKRGTVEQLDSNLKLRLVYFADTGQRAYERNRSFCRKPYKLDKANEFIRFAENEIINKKLSPDAVCGRAKLEGMFDVTVCTKTLYNYISKGLIKVKNIDLLLRVRRNTHKHRCRINRRILGASIEERPEIVNSRTEFGHWEIDTIVGKRNTGEVLLTLDERMTRKRHIIKIDGKNKKSVEHALVSLKKEYGELFPRVFKTVTSDNGSEFCSLQEFLVGINVYFAHPYSAGERGTNEKQNSIVRRFIPKGKNIGEVSAYFVQTIENFINNLPRKMFGYRTPKELFDEQISLLAHIL